MSTTDISQNRDIREPRFGFWWRSYAMLVKEFIQLRRDRISFAMIVMLPVMQLVLFGFAINTTPRNLPTAVLLQEDSDLGRSILKALENTAYFRFTREVHDVAERVPQADDHVGRGRDRGQVDVEQAERLGRGCVEGGQESARMRAGQVLQGGVERQGHAGPL